MIKVYSDEYQKNRAFSLNQPYTWSPFGLPVYDHSSHNFILPMVDSDNWDNLDDVLLTDLTPLPIKKFKVYTIGLSKMMSILRFFRVVPIFIPVLLFTTNSFRYRTITFSYIREIKLAMKFLPVFIMSRMLKYISFEVNLQMTLLAPTRKSLAIAQRMVKLGEGKLIARLCDSVPDSYFAHVYSQMSEETAAIIMPFLQRPERMRIARHLYSNLHTLPQAIVELMNKEEQARKTSNELKLLVNQLEKNHSDLESKNIELDLINNKLKETTDKIRKYVPAQLAENLILKQEETVPKRKKVTIFFSDIKNFTVNVDQMQPEELSYLLNHYLDEMVTIASNHGATIDKFIGDAVMAFFGAPSTLGEKQDAINCALMALEMQRKMNELQLIWKKKGIGNGFQIRIGINTGFCTVGDFGSETRKDYTVIGKEVNLASRLESMATPGGILISQSTHDLIGDLFSYGKESEITPKGFSHPIRCYSLEAKKIKTDSSIAKSHIRDEKKLVKLIELLSEDKKNQIETWLSEVQS